MFQLTCVITVISCLFTSVINSRLTFLSTEIISKNQSGFRKGFSTTDNIFIKHALVSIYFSLEKFFYCTFVDFRKAFDTVWRTGLWKKCLSMVNAIKLSIICMIILNLVICIMISNQTVFLVWLVFCKEKTCPSFIFCVFKRFRRLFQKFSWVSTRNCKGNT